MLSADHAIRPHASHGSLRRRIGASWLKDWRISAYSLILISLLLIIPSNLAPGDEFTGQSQDDPKDLIPSSTPAPRPQSTDEILFLPLPSWSRGVTMPQLPDQLKPMGKKVTVATASTASAPASLTPPKEIPSIAPASVEAASKVKTSPTSAEPSPDLVAVSPFLQWIKANPQAASAEARQQANGYHAPSTSEPGPAGGNSGGASISSGANGSAGDPYWLPPLIDSADFSSSPVGGSAAIYQTPQR
jgi:hypothetical protein